MYKNYKVILIGGSPLVGKTSLALKLSSKFEYGCISTDDIGQVLKTVIDNHPMNGIDYREYYIKNALKELVSDVKKLHRQALPAIKLLIENHSSYSSPIIIEGFALYPSLIKTIKSKNVKGVWLIGDKDIFEKRLRNSRNFYEGASDEEKLISKFCQRSIRHNEIILKEVKKYKEDYIRVSKDLTKEKILKKAMKIFGEN